MPGPSADALRINTLLKVHGSAHRVAAELNVPVQTVVDILKDPTKSLPQQQAAGGSSAMWKAPYGSLKAAVQDPALTVTKGALNTNMLYLSRVYVPDPTTLQKVWWIINQAGSAVTAAELAVWDPVNLLMLGRTGDVTAKVGGSANGPQNAVLNPVSGRSLAMPGGDGSWVMVGFRQTGTNLSQLAGYTMSNTLIGSLDGQPSRATNLGSQASLPDQLQFLPGGASLMLWFGLS